MAAANLIIPVRDLQVALGFMLSTIEKRNTVPNLSNVLFPGDGTMKATDLDQELTWTIGDTPHPAFTVNAAALQKIVKGADKGKLVSIGYTPHPTGEGDGKALVEADCLKSTLASMPVEDFPSAGIERQLLIRFSMQAEELRDLLSFCSTAISTEETRYYLKGIFLHSANNHLAAVATDGHRLAFKKSAYSWPSEDHNHGRILPHKVVKTLLSLIGKKPTGTVDVQVYDNLFIFTSTEGWTLRAKIINGSFPDYNHVIPKSPFKFRADLDPAKLDTAIKRLIPLAADRYAKGVLDVSDNLLVTQDEDKNPHKLPLGLLEAFGEGRVCMNMNYLKDAIGTYQEFGAKMLTLQPADGGACLLTSPQVEDALMVIMAIRSTVDGYEWIGE